MKWFAWRVRADRKGMNYIVAKSVCAAEFIARPAGWIGPPYLSAARSAIPIGAG